MKGDQIYIFTLMVDSEFGVLTRVTALIRRSGWNIRSLAVSETAVLEVSRLTISLECKGITYQTVLDKLGRLDCVREIALFSPDAQATRELALVRLERPCSSDELTELCAGCMLELLEKTDGTVLFSLAGPPFALDAALDRVKKLGDVDTARTGPIALKKCVVQEAQQ